MHFLKRTFLLTISIISLSINIAQNASSEEKSEKSVEPFLNIYYSDNITYARNESWKENDVIWELGIITSYKTGYPVFYTKLFAGMSVDLFTNHSTFNYETYKLGLTQGLLYKTISTFSYTLIPDFCYEADFIVSACIESTDYHTFTLSLDKEFTSSLSGGIFGKYGIEDYNTLYYYGDAKDTKIIGAGIDIGYQIIPIIKIDAGYSYETGEANGKDNAYYSYDVSYFQHGFYIKPIFNITNDINLNIGYMFSNREYTSKLIYDIDNYKRRDYAHKFHVKAGYFILKDLELTAGYERTILDSNKSRFDNHQNIFMFGGTYFFF